MNEAYSLRIFGRVQGVAFRYYAQIQAKKLGVYGWVKNMPDGSVELFCEGETDKLSRMIKWAEKGPPSAGVILVKKRKVQTKGCFAFTVEY